MYSEYNDVSKLCVKLFSQLRVLNFMGLQAPTISGSMCVTRCKYLYKITKQN